MVGFESPRPTTAIPRLCTTRAVRQLVGAGVLCRLQLSRNVTNIVPVSDTVAQVQHPAVHVLPIRSERLEHLGGNDADAFDAKVRTEQDPCWEVEVRIVELPENAELARRVERRRPARLTDRTAQPDSTRRSVLRIGGADQTPGCGGGERLAKRAGPLSRSDRADTTSGLGTNAL